MRITFCWADVAGYMADCWRALAARPGVELSVLAFAANAPGAHTAFDDTLMAGVPARILAGNRRHDAAAILDEVAAREPDVVFVSGWFHRPYVALASAPRLRRARFVMTMDTPWQGAVSQRLARWALRSYLGRVDRVLVAGERSFQYARRLGFAEGRIHRGVYGRAVEPLRTVHAARLTSGAWPRQFLYMGRYVPKKGVDVLVEAYARYRARVDDPWALRCCGAGPLAPLLTGRAGVEDAGFVQPRDQGDVLRDAGAFVLASRYEPWGVVVLEACAAGLPVVCTESCGAGLDLVRSHYNGFTVATGDVSSLAEAMMHVHESYDALPTMGARGLALAGAYSAEVWADRVIAIARAAMASAGAL